MQRIGTRGRAITATAAVAVLLRLCRFQKSSFQLRSFHSRPSDSAAIIAANAAAVVVARGCFGARRSAGGGVVVVVVCSTNE